MLKRRKKPFDLEKQVFTVTFLRITETEYDNGSNHSERMALWKKNGINNRMKTFIFKFFNNLLGINTRLSHFVDNWSRKCTFCNSKAEINQSDETFKHLFLDCKYTMQLHNSFMQKYLPELGIVNYNDKKKLFFHFMLPNSEQFNSFIGIVLASFQYCVWEYKLMKKVPSFNTIEIKFCELVSSCLRLNKECRESAGKINLLLPRAFGIGYADPDPEPVAAVHPRRLQDQQHGGPQRQPVPGGAAPH
jgi:hypothetical protein